MTQTPEQIAAGLNPSEAEFLKRVCDARRLRLADRKEDRARQMCRRLGLVHVVLNPRRWEALPLGQQVRTILEKNNG
jgi:hypothetical protein